MKAPYLHYAFFKKVTLDLNPMIKNEIIYDDNLIFNLSNFINIGDYYSLKSFKDKYDFNNKLNEKFNEFIVECLILLNKHNEYDKLYFLYSLVSSYTLDKYINEYIESLNNDVLSKEEIYKMIDFSIASKDNIDISKNNLYKIFKNSFEYYNYMDDLIHNPCIRVLKFMASKAYFIRCYKKKKKYYKSFMKYNIKYPLHLLLSKITKSKIKTKDLIYKDIRDIDLPLISDELLEKAYIDTKMQINAINEYLFDDKDSNVRRLYNIDKDKKI